MTTRDFCKENLYDYRLGVHYESLSVQLTYLEEIYYSVCKRVLSGIGHWDMI